MNKSKSYSGFQSLFYDAETGDWYIKTDHGWYLSAENPDYGMSEPVAAVLGRAYRDELDLALVNSIDEPDEAEGWLLRCGLDSTRDIVRRLERYSVRTPIETG